MIVFPNDAEMVPIPQCRDGRVVLLKFKEGNKKLFFWLQEPDSKKDKDEELIKKVNEALNNPSRGGSHTRGGDDAEGMCPNFLFVLFLFRLIKLIFEHDLKVTSPKP